MVELAAALAALLAPALPFLTRAGEHVLDEATTKMGSEAWEHAQRLWQRLRDAVAARPGAQDAADDVAKHPTDPDAEAGLRRQLLVILESDEELARDMKHLVGEAPPSAVIAIGARSVAAKEMSGRNTIVTGDKNRFG